MKVAISLIRTNNEIILILTFLFIKQILHIPGEPLIKLKEVKNTFFSHTNEVHKVAVVFIQKPIYSLTHIL